MPYTMQYEINPFWIASYCTKLYSKQIWFTSYAMQYELNQFWFVSYCTKSYSKQFWFTIYDLHYEMNQFWFVSYCTKSHMKQIWLTYMPCNMNWINFDSHYIAHHFVSNKLDLLRISCNLIRNTIWPTHISRSKTSRRTGADRKRESMWGCAMGIIKQRLILPAFWWCSDRRPPRCMKRESGENPEQCPLL